MKNNKGFTLVELLAVIALLGIIVAIAVPSVMGVTQMIQSNMVEKKAEVIEEAAILFGEDIKGSIISSNLRYKDNYQCKSFVISDLVPNYVDKDNDNTCLNLESDTDTNGCVIYPNDNNKYMDLLEVIIYYKNKRIHAVVDLNDELTCS